MGGVGGWGGSGGAHARAHTTQSRVPPFSGLSPLLEPPAAPPEAPPAAPPEARPRTHEHVVRGPRRDLSSAPALERARSTPARARSTRARGTLPAPAARRRALRRANSVRRWHEERPPVKGPCASGLRTARASVDAGLRPELRRALSHPAWLGREVARLSPTSRGVDVGRALTYGRRHSRSSASPVDHKRV